MEALIFFIVAIFLFSFVGVIGLIIRTASLKKENIYLNKKLEELARKLSEQPKPAPEPRPQPAVQPSYVSQPVAKPAPAPVPQPVQQPVIVSAAEKVIEKPLEPEPAPEPKLPEDSVYKVPVMPPSESKQESPSWSEPLKKFIRGGNLWAAGGVILLITAFGMLIAFLASRGFFTVEMGIAAAAVCGILMMVFGWRFKERRPTYFLLLQGGGTGILYLAVFAAHKLTPYFPAPASLLLLTILLIPAVVLALVQNSQALALLGFLGGFAAPILLSSGQGNHVFLFSYYAVLNAAILVINFRKLWKWLGAAAFICTFGVLIYWVLKNYETAMYLTAQPFSIGFIIIFTIIGILYLKDGEISSINFSIIAGTPLLGMFVQWHLVSHFPHAHAISSIAFSAYYLLLIILIRRRLGAAIRPVAEGYLALVVILANVAIPLELSKDVTSAVWAAEGVVLLLLGLRLANVQFQIWGYVVHVAGAIAFGINEDPYYLKESVDKSMFLSAQFIGSIIIALSAFVMALLVNHFKSRKELISKFLTVWAFIWWFGGFFYEFNRIANYSLAGAVYNKLNVENPWGLLLITCSVSVLLFYCLSRLFRYPWFNIAIFPAILAAIITIGDALGYQIWSNYLDSPTKILTYNFFYEEYLWGWLLFFASNILLIILFRKKTEEPIPEKLHSAWIFTIAVIALYVLTTSGRALTDYLKLSESWTSLAGILPSLVALFGIIILTKYAQVFTEFNKKLFLFVMPMLLSIVLGVWFIVTLFMTGNPAPLPMYIPFINPLDLQQGFCIIGITLWFIINRKKTPWATNNLLAWTDIMVFLWIIAIIGRSVHFYAGVKMYFMWGSSIYQLCLFIFLALYGIAHIIAGNKKLLRPVWIAGAILVIIDIVKLLLLDLAGTGAISRIVSFFIAGAVLLFIGWVAPLPPSKPKEQ
jgi:uncharacterized membrane protein